MTEIEPGFEIHDNTSLCCWRKWLRRSKRSRLFACPGGHKYSSSSAGNVQINEVCKRKNILEKNKFDIINDAQEKLISKPKMPYFCNSLRHTHSLL